jgi:hypothetical protein
MARPPTARYSRAVQPVEWDAVVAALVSLWFFVSAAYGVVVAVAAFRTGRFAPELGLEVHGRAAIVSASVTLVLAAAFLAAGLLIARVAAFR